MYVYHYTYQELELQHQSDDFYKNKKKEVK